MVDNMNPSNQFHPYQPETSTPHADVARSGGIGDLLKKVGINQSSIDSMGSSMKNINMGSVRNMAQKNPGAVLGGLAALVIGAGLLRGRR
jgi:hypothetical protein